jgi:hypothetical protein
MRGMHAGAVGLLLACLCLVVLVGCPGELAPICEPEPSVQCGACGAQGFVCAGGDKPRIDGGPGPYECSVQSTAGGMSTYCCFGVLLPTSCTPLASWDLPSDAGMSLQCDPDQGYVCGIGDNPAAFWAGLTCEGPVRVDGNDVFCCQGSRECP